MVLGATPAPFCLELGALAARREYLNLEKWLADQFTAKGSQFMQATVAFLDARLRSEQPALQTAATAVQLPGAAAPGGGRISLAEGTLEVFLRVLAANAGLLPSDTLQQFKMVQAAAVQAHPSLAAVVGDSSSLEAFAPDIGALPALRLCVGAPRCCFLRLPGSRAAVQGVSGEHRLTHALLHLSPSPPPPAEEEANAYFQRVYAGEIGVEELVGVLRAYKHSTLGREQVGWAGLGWGALVGGVHQPAACGLAAWLLRHHG